MRKPLPGPKSKKGYRLLKPSWLAPALLLAAAILCCFAAPPNPRLRSGVGGSAACGSNACFESSSGSGANYDSSLDNGESLEIFYDITAFRKARMALPERHELFCPAAGHPAESRDKPPEVNKHESPASFLTEFGHLLPYTDELDEVFDVPGNVFMAGPLPNEYRLIQSQAFDLNGDGSPEKYTLRNGKVTVQADSRIVWQSPEDWWVDYFFLGDADNNGAPELCLLLWKEGSFGPYKPFWLEKDDCSIKNHLFIYRLHEDRFKPVWQSSNLDCPNYLAALVDLNGNGENELLVIESSYTAPEKKELTRWKWNGWGFSRVD